MFFYSTLLYILHGHCIQDYLVYPTLVCIWCKTHQVLTGRQRRSCVVWPMVGNWEWEGFLHKFRLMGVFLVNTLLIRICVFFSFVFAKNSLKSLPINCFAVLSSTTNQNVSFLNLNCVAVQSSTTNQNVLFFKFAMTGN